MRSAMNKTQPLAIIPARGGSKRIPRKNIKKFLGVPLVQRTIKTLVESEIFSQVVVSTDDDEIAGVAEAVGAVAPFRRPSKLADDHTATVPVILHALDWLEDHGVSFSDVAVVYPAAVFIDADDLTMARHQMESSEVDQVFSACEFDAPIQRAWRIADNGHAVMEHPEHEMTRSQDLEPRFYDAGQFYWWAEGTREKLVSGSKISRALHLLSRTRVQDIDTPEDWLLAEMKYQMRK